MIQEIERKTSNGLVMVVVLLAAGVVLGFLLPGRSGRGTSR